MNPQSGAGNGAQANLLLSALQSLAQNSAGRPMQNASPFAGVQTGGTPPQVAYSPMMPGAFNPQQGGGANPLASLLSSGGSNSPLSSLMSGNNSTLGGVGNSLGNMFGKGGVPSTAGGQYASLLGGGKGAGSAIDSSGMSLADMLGNGMIAM
jgi:hypothetical protein